MRARQAPRLTDPWVTRGNSTHCYVNFLTGHRQAVKNLGEAGDRRPATGNLTRPGHLPLPLTKFDQAMRHVGYVFITEHATMGAWNPTITHGFGRVASSTMAAEDLHHDSLRDVQGCIEAAF